MATKRKEPKWLKSIPKSNAHGRSDTQKRYWKLTSDYVRIRDFYRHGQKCSSCHIRFTDWREGQAGHWKSWGASNAYSKWNLNNLAIQCGGCNGFPDGPRMAEFRRHMIRIHGEDFEEQVNRVHIENSGKRLDDRMIEIKILELIDKFDELEEEPDYLSRTKMLLEELSN